MTGRMDQLPTVPLSALTRCLQEEANAIAAAAERLDAAQVEQALEQLEACRQRRAKLVITGIGKSGIVARKIAATFSSIGLTAVFLNPVDALHGDLGIVHPDDVALLLSNSGETEELLAILPHLRRRGTARIALVGRLGSSLARGCDVVLDGSVDREVCPLNLAPTASTAVAMAIGDALAAVWMERAGISPVDFAINHPAGSLGRQLTLTVADLMVPASELTPLAPDAPLPAVIAHLTQGSPSRGSLGASWVHATGDPATLAGLITDGDLRRTLQKHKPGDWGQVTAAQMATTEPITVTPEVLAAAALELMERNPRKPISVLPVVEPDQPGRVAGLLRLHDLVQAGFSQSSG
jgi:arabinose-5-phosphate isomerase